MEALLWLRQSELSRISAPSVVVTHSPRDSPVLALDSLPNELLHFIAHFLTPRDLLALSEVNSKWQEIANDDKLWRRLFEMEFLRSEEGIHDFDDESFRSPFRIHKYLYFSAFKRRERRPKTLIPYTKRSMITGDLVGAYATPRHFIAFTIGLFGPIMTSNILSMPLLRLRPRHTLAMVYAVSVLSSYIVFRNWGAYYDQKGDRPLEARYRYLGCLGPLIIGQWAAGMHRLARLNSELYRKRLLNAFDIFLAREVNFIRIIHKYLKTSIWQLSFGFLGYLVWMALFDII